MNADGDQHMGGVDEDAEGEQGVSLSSSLFVSRFGLGRREIVAGEERMTLGWGSMRRGESNV